MPTLPSLSHGDTLPVTRIEAAYEGRGEARHENGIKVTVLLPFDAFASVPVTIPGVDVTNFPSNDVITERNMALRFLVGKFKNLVISFSGGDYGAVRYRGTASGLTILNLNPAPQSAPQQK